MSDIATQLSLIDSRDSPDLFEVIAKAADEIERLVAEVARLRNGIQDYLDGDYGRGHFFETKHDYCPHQKFQWEDCSVCIDAYFKKLLDVEHLALVSQRICTTRDRLACHPPESGASSRSSQKERPPPG